VGFQQNYSYFLLVLLFFLVDFITVYHISENLCIPTPQFSHPRSRSNCIHAL
jgi:hypothetical protein